MQEWNEALGVGARSISLSGSRKVSELMLAVAAVCERVRVKEVR